MIPIEYIIALSMAIINTFKKKLPVSWNDSKPLLALILAVSLHLLNAYVFDGNLKDAGKEAFITAGIMFSLFSGGSAINKIIK